jgi:hypothetical protein
MERRAKAGKSPLPTGLAPKAGVDSTTAEVGGGATDDEPTTQPSPQRQQPRRQPRSKRGAQQRPASRPAAGQKKPGTDAVGGG